MEEEKKVEETKEIKPTYKKHGPLYWLIIVVGMTFIVFMSIQMGMKIAEEKIDKEDGGKPSVTSNSNSNKPEENKEAIEKSVQEKMKILFPGGEGKNLSRFANTAAANFFAGKFAESDKISFAIANVEASKVVNYTYTNGKFTNDNIKQEVLEEVTYAAKDGEKVESIKAEDMAVYYKKVFGTEPNYTDATMDCPVYYYDSLNKYYIPISRCGGVGYSADILYIDSYNISEDSVVVTTYVGSYSASYGENKTIYSTPMTSTGEEVKYKEIKEDAEFKIDDSNKTSFAKYNFTFKKATDGDYYFESVTKAN